MNEFTIWVAEAENGSVQFDTPPSKSDIRNDCEDLEGPIEVFELSLVEIRRSYQYTIDDD